MRWEREIFTFGSNTQGRHGAGAALYARMHHGARYGQARGLQGNSYAIVTKELRRSHPPVALDDVRREVIEFIAFAASRPTWLFKVTPVGCGLAGFSPEDVAPMFRGAPSNVDLNAFKCWLGADDDV